VNQPIARNEGLVSLSVYIVHYISSYFMYQLRNITINIQFCPALDDTVSVLGLGWDWKDILLHWFEK